MKKVLLFFVLLSSACFAEECIHKPFEGQACLNAKTLPKQMEVQDRAGRKVLLSFSPSNMMECQVTLENFHPNEKFVFSTLTFGEAHAFSGQVSAAGSDHFFFDLTPEKKTRCSCTELISVIKILPEGEQTPLKFVINWNK